MTKPRSSKEMGEDDFIVALGLPFIAHRLRRLFEAVVDATARYQKELGFEGPIQSASMILLLAREEKLGITEVAKRLRLTHPMIVKMVRALAEGGYVKEEGDPKDARRRIVSLTQKGRRQADLFLPFSQLLTAALQEIFRETGSDLYRAVQDFEGALARRDLTQRIHDVADRQENS